MNWTQAEKQERDTLEALHIASQAKKIKKLIEETDGEIFVYIHPIGRSVCDKLERQGVKLTQLYGFWWRFKFIEDPNDQR